MPFALGREPGQIALKLAQEIECQEFTQRVRGKSPKEHEEMDALARVQEMQRQWREEEVARANQWRAEDKAWQREVERRIGRRHKEAILWAVLAAALTAIATVAGAYVALGK
jgi:hypothetical protein